MLDRLPEMGWLAYLGLALWPTPPSPVPDFGIKKTVTSGGLLSKNPPQKSLIREKDWDSIFVLDACRYDYFEKVYGDYLDGELKKVTSSGSSTSEWLKKTFDRKAYKDVTYISASPFVNSKTKVGPKPRKNFREILDVWDFGWNKELNTVLPIEVIKIGSKVNTKKILHFLQPHAPYLGEERGISLSSVSPLKTYPPLVQTLSTIGQYLNEKVWKKILKMGARYIITQDGIDSVLKGYEGNLRLVLEKISNYIDEFEGKIVITSDHGEAFGENGIYEHPPHQIISALREVPWLEIVK